MNIARVQVFLILFICLAIPYCFLNVGSPRAQAKQSTETRKIHGAVMDRHDKGISGVLVRAYRGNLLVGDSRTTETGQYSIVVDVGQPITIIRYDHSDWYATTVNEISGARDNFINKILIKQGDHLSLAMQKDLVFTIERLYQIDRANRISDDSFKMLYRIMIDRAKLSDDLLAKLPIPFDLSSDQIVRTLTTGKWRALAFAPGVTYEFILKFRIDGDKVTGESTTKERVLPIASASLNGNELTVVINSSRGPFSLKALVTNEELVGEYDLAGEVGGSWRAERTD